VHDYANAVLQGRQYLPDEEDEHPASGSRQKEGEGDLGVEVARLNYGIVSFEWFSGSKLTGRKM
jgi:hypothetical protein